MHLGATVAGRFRIEARVGAGAMGEVFRAADLTDGRVVAIKLLRENVPDGRPRFSREVRALERLSHPGIVGHVAHGQAALPYLVMEWLEGEDLRARLAREPLTIEQTVRLGCELADALAHVHEHGAVHRDVKPSNIILERGAIERPKLVDFGLARLLDVDGQPGEEFASASGILVGTPGYMAPEQARGSAGPPADVFGLGCLLYKCLTGHPPFQAPDMVGTLARVLFDDAAPPSEQVPQTPAALDALLLRMLAKDAPKRPTAREVEQALRRIGGHETTERRTNEPRALTGRERRIVSVVLAYRGANDDGEETLLGTKSSVAAPEVLERVRALGEEYAAHVEFLGPSVLAVFADRGGATEQSARAARFALALRAVLREIPIAVTTGRAEIAQRIVGDAVESAVALARVTAPTRVAADPITVGLLGADFEVASEGDRLWLVRALPRGEVAPRTLLGKPTPCVGRDRELSALDAALSDVIAGPRAEVALFVAPSGTGKSRLRYEWLRRLRERGGTHVVTARCDAMTGTAPLALAAQWVREAASVVPADPPERAHALIAARVAAIAPPADAPRLTDFLAEIAGANPPKAPVGVQLSEARDDPMLMSDQVRAAFTDWLRWETETMPFVGVVDDLQWGDAASVRLIDAALDALREAPLFVFALARPELHASFPALWEGRNVAQRQLGELGTNAATELARSVLGGDASADEISALVKRASGNAFFLEEMLRAHAEGQDGDAPATVQAVVQRRLESFDEPVRRALRAAAIFGMSFWTGSVEALVGGGKAEAVLRTLRDREVVSPRPTARFEGDEEWVFRHAYVRDAAYAMLTSEDRMLGHRLAGEWLEARGERDALVVADHFERGGRAERAVPHLRRAAKQALDGNDLDLVVKNVERARAAGATGEALGELARYAAEALRWRARLAEAVSYAELALQELSPSTPTWYAALAELATASTVQGSVEALLRAQRLLVEDPSPNAFVGARVVALARLAGQLVVAGRPAEADATITLAERSDLGSSVRAQARLAQARSLRALHASDPANYRRNVSEAQLLFEAIGDRRNACVQAVNLASAMLNMGRTKESIERFEAARATAASLGLARIVALMDQNVAQAWLAEGDVERSIEVQQKAAAFFEAQRDRRLECYSRIYLAWALAAAGRQDDAVAEAERAVVAGGPLPPALAGARATLADQLMRRGGEDERAAELARAAHATLEELGGLEECEALVRIVFVEAAFRRGDVAAARAELNRALTRLDERMKDIEEPSWRVSFLSNVAEHARVIARARAEIARVAAGEFPEAGTVTIPPGVAATLATELP